MRIPNRRARAAAQTLGVLAAGMVAGTFMTAPPRAEGEGELAARVIDLTNRVAALEKGEHTAPFVVKDGAGLPIFRIDSSGGDATLMLGTAGGTATLSAGQEVELNLSHGSGGVVLTSSDEGSGLAVKGGEGQIFVEQKGGPPQIRITDGSADIFNVGSEGGSPALTVKKGDQTVTMTAAAGNTGVIASDGDHDYQIGSIKNVRGFVASAGGKPLAGLGGVGSDKFRVAIFDNGQPVFTGGYDTGGKLGMFLAEGGNNVAKIEPIGGGGKLTLLGAGAKEIATLGIPPGGGDGGALSLSKGSEQASFGFFSPQGAAISLKDGSDETFSVHKDGAGAVLKLGKGENGLTAKTSSTEATVNARIGNNLVQMGIGAKSIGFVIGQPGAPLAGLVDNGDKKPFLGIYGGGSNALLSAGYQEDGKLAFRLGEKSNPLALLAETSAGSASATLTLYNAGVFGATLGPLPGSPRPNLRIYDGGEIAFAAGVTPAGMGAMAVYDHGSDESSAGMEAASGGNGVVYVSTGGKVVASMNTNDEPGKPVFAIRNGAGVAVAHLGLSSSGDGGNVTATDPSGFNMFSAGYASDGAGEACVNRRTQAGTNRTGCIGLALPSAGMGK